MSLTNQSLQSISIHHFDSDLCTKSPIWMYQSFHKATSPTKTQTKKPCKSLIYKAFQLVEVAGFEPAAFWSRTKRATKLRYTSILEPMRGLEPLAC